MGQVSGRQARRFRNGGLVVFVLSIVDATKNNHEKQLNLFCSVGGATNRPPEPNNHPR